MDLVLFGIQGSGKGTQAKKLAADFGYDIFEAGGELRKIAASGSELGATVKGYIDAGNLVPHEIIMQVVQEAIEQRDADTPILFDGIPRDESQQKDFDTVMSNVGRDFVCVEITLDEQEAINRIAHRAEEEGRVDDANADIIQKRMNTFHQKTRPVIQQYTEQGNMKTVDGNGSVEEIYERLTRVLGLEL